MGRRWLIINPFYAMVPNYLNALQYLTANAQMLILSRQFVSFKKHNEGF